MNREDVFYKELAATPELPSDVYNRVCKKISRKILVKRTMTVALAFAILTFSYIIPSKNTTVTGVIIEPEIASELQIIQDYLYGTDITEDSLTYAFLGLD